jgi:hypothetical protein
MSQYTKGPWDYATRTENDILISVRINDASHATVCTVHGSTSPLNDQYVGASKLTANVKLICAAPDLLEALIAMNAQLEADGYMGTTYGPLRMAATKAIAKAMAPKS